MRSHLDAPITDGFKAVSLALVHLPRIVTSNGVDVGHEHELEHEARLAQPRGQSGPDQVMRWH
jgi:hypothetical protein